MNYLNTSSKRDRNNLEIASKTPNLGLIQEELEAAQGDMDNYLQRNDRAYNYWQSRWPGQTISGRKEGENALPWPNASDIRVRTVKQNVRDHVSVAKFAFNGSRIQAKSTRPLAPGQGRQSNQVTKLLQWEIGTHMRPNLQREVPLAWSWRFGYGLAVMNIEWYTARRLEFHKLTVNGLAEWIALQEKVEDSEFPRLLAEVIDAMTDPSREEALAYYVQTLAPDDISRSQARKIVVDLRQVREAEVPIPYVFQSLPVWTALRAGVDIIFPGETSDFQVSRFTGRPELVTETELKDRIRTEEYDKDFVAEAIRHKGEDIDGTWLNRTLEDRGGGMPPDAFQHMIKLMHFDSKVSHNGTPCLYRTTFCPSMVRSRKDKALYAKHGPRTYSHGLVPYVEMRFEKEQRSILSSQGIAESAYSWEQTLKTQIDGINNRTELVLRPPLITRHKLVHAVQNNLRPGATMGAERPQEMTWFPAPPMDNSPDAIIRWVDMAISRFFGLFDSGDVPLDADLKRVRWAEVGSDVLGELTNCASQTKKLMQQFIPDEDVAAVAGTLQRPFQVSPEEIQQEHEITVTYDMQMMDGKYAMDKLDQIAKWLPFSQGNANMNSAFRVGMEIIDPDIADQVVEDDQQANEKERKDEINALVAIMQGVEPDKPQFANHQLRLQVLEEKTQNPVIQKKIAQDPGVFELLQNRIEYHQNQIQQFTQNPGIGRALSTQTFNTKAAPTMESLPAQ